MNVSFTLDGDPVEVDVAPDRPLREVLRRDCDRTSVKSGCDSGRCGTCSVLLDGDVVKACLVPAATVDGSTVTTVEALHERPLGRALQDAFEEQFALQCGYCTPGFLLSAVAYLEDHPDPDRDAIRAAIEGNVCRCTGYERIVDAIEQAARDVQADRIGTRK